MAKALVLGLTLFFYIIAFGLAVGAIAKRSRVSYSFDQLVFCSRYGRGWKSLFFISSSSIS